MSTTWVFLELLAGREIAMSLRDTGGKGKPSGNSLKLIGRDVGYALIGLSVSIALAVAINEEIKVDTWNFFFG